MLGSVNGLCVMLCARSQSPRPSMNGKMCWIKVSSSRGNGALSDAWASRPQERGREGPADGGQSKLLNIRGENSGTWKSHHVSNAARDESHVHL